MVFQCFSLSSPSPKILQKCSRNCPRTSQVELKMPILAPSLPILALSWPILAPSWPILAPSWPILDATFRQPCPNFAHLAPIFAPTSLEIPTKTRQRPQEAPQGLPRRHFPLIFDSSRLHFALFLAPTRSQNTARNSSRPISEYPSS